MPKIAVVAVLFLFFAGLAFAQDVETPAAPEAPAAESVEPAQPPAVIDGMTAEDLLRKWSEKYAAAQTYYEESDVAVTMDMGGERQEQKILLTAAFKRPDRVKIDLAGPGNVTLSYENGQVTFLDRDQNRYGVDSGVTLADLAAQLQDVGLDATPISPDPYAAIKADVVRVNDIKTAEFAGKEVYQIDVEKNGGLTVANYFDKKTLYLIGMVSNVTMPLPQGGIGAFTLAKTASNVMIDEFPKTADGADVDVFAFVIPEGAVKAEEPAPEMEEPQEEESTDSVLEIPEGQ